MEIWRDIPGYEGEYEASSNGRIRTKEGKMTWSKRFCTYRVWRQRFLKQKWQSRKSGLRDARVELWHDNRCKTMLVARCVCAAFYPISNMQELTVNHKDGNPENNCADNLEWLTRGDNIRHGFAKLLYGNQKHVTLISESDGSHIDFNSLSQANRYLGRSNSYLSEIAKRHGERACSASGENFTYIIAEKY